MQNKILIVLACLISPLVCAAGQETHGGDVLVCLGQAPVVLDYYVASLPSRAGPIQMENLSGKSAVQILNLTVGKLGDSYLGSLLRKKMPFYLDANNWIQASALVDVQDDGLVFNLPAGCSLAQAAVRQPGGIYFDPQYVNQLDEAQFAILTLHELIYEAAILGGNTSSNNVKTVVRALLNANSNTNTLKLAAHSIGQKYSYLELFKSTDEYICSSGNCNNSNYFNVSVDTASDKFLVSTTSPSGKCSSELTCNETGSSCSVSSGPTMCHFFRDGNMDTLTIKLGVDDLGKVQINEYRNNVLIATYGVRIN